MTRKLGQIKMLRNCETKSLTQYIEKINASVRPHVKHPFQVGKNRYRCIAKNESQWQVRIAKARLYMIRKVIIARGLA